MIVNKPGNQIGETMESLESLFLNNKRFSKKSKWARWVLLEILHRNWNAPDLINEAEGVLFEWWFSDYDLPYASMEVFDDGKAVVITESVGGPIKVKEFSVDYEPNLVVNLFEEMIEMNLELDI